MQKQSKCGSENYSIVKLTEKKYGSYDERKGTMFFATFFTKANWLPCTKINAAVTINVIVGNRKKAVEISHVVTAVAAMNEALKKKEKE